MADDDKIELDAGDLDVPSQIPEGPLEMPVLPVRHTVLFPHAILPLNVGRPKSLQLLNDIMNGDRRVAVID